MRQHIHGNSISSTAELDIDFEIFQSMYLWESLNYATMESPRETVVAGKANSCSVGSASFALIAAKIEATSVGPLEKSRL